MLTVPFFVTAFDYSLNKYALKFSLRKGGCWTFSPSSFFQVDCQLPKRGALSLNSPFSPPGHITGAQEEFVQKKEKRKVRKNLLIKKKKILKKRDHRTRRLIENISRCSRTQWIATSFRSRQSGFFAGRLTLDAGTASQAERASGPGTGSAGLGLWDSCGGKSLLLLRDGLEVSASGLSVPMQKAPQPSTHAQHHRDAEASDVSWLPPPASRLHALHYRLPGTSRAMCTLISDDTFPWLGRIPTP